MFCLRFREAKGSLVDPDGKVDALIVGAGGFLDAGEKGHRGQVRCGQEDREGQFDLSDDQHHQGRTEVRAGL
jgi:hypothetical protein